MRDRGKRMLAKVARIVAGTGADRGRMFGGGWLALCDCGGGCWRWCFVWGGLGALRSTFDAASADGGRRSWTIRKSRRRGAPSRNARQTKSYIANPVFGAEWALVGLAHP